MYPGNRTFSFPSIARCLKRCASNCLSQQITRICFSAPMFEAQDQNIQSMSLLLRMEGSDSPAATGLWQLDCVALWWSQLNCGNRIA